MRCAKFVSFGLLVILDGSLYAQAKTVLSEDPISRLSPISVQLIYEGADVIRGQSPIRGVVLSVKLNGVVGPSEVKIDDQGNFAIALPNHAQAGNYVEVIAGSKPGLYAHGGASVQAVVLQNIAAVPTAPKPAGSVVENHGSNALVVSPSPVSPDIHTDSGVVKPKAATDSENHETRMISGVVRNRDTDTPIRGALVRLVCGAGNSILALDRTDAKGKYNLSYLPIPDKTHDSSAATCTLESIGPGYSKKWQLVTS